MASKSRGQTTQPHDAESLRNTVAAIRTWAARIESVAESMEAEEIPSLDVPREPSREAVERGIKVWGLECEDALIEYRKVHKKATQKVDKSPRPARASSRAK